MKKSQSALIGAAILLLSLTALPVGAGQHLPQTSARNWPSSTFFGDYEPREPKSLNDLPLTVRRNLVAHLVDRLGEAYFQRLTFAGGQIVDVDKVPDIKSYKWKVFNYRLFFRLSEPNKGVAEYYAAIDLDRDGAVIEEIELPPVRRLPAKAQFIPLSQAYAVAKKRGFDPPNTRAELIYVESIESIAFRLTQVVVESDYGDTVRTIEVDAHSGRVLRIYKSQFVS